MRALVSLMLKLCFLYYCKPVSRDASVVSYLEMTKQKSKQKTNQKVKTSGSGGKEQPSRPAGEASTRLFTTAPGINSEQLTGTTNGLAKNEDKVARLKLSISLLFMLSEYPKIPPSLQKEFDHRLHSAGNQCLSLTLQNEKAILEAFTFISSSSKDPRKVAAFCIDTKLNGRGEDYVLTVAANHGDLEPLKAQIEQILTLLNHKLSPSDATHPQFSTRFEHLLKIIVDWNVNRILCNIQSRHANWSKTQCKRRKMAEKPVLPALCQLHQDTSAFSEFDTTTTARMVRLRALSDELESLAQPNTVALQTPSCTILADMVKISYGLWRTAECRVRFRRCAKLWRPIVKLSRYCSVVLFLIRHANASETFESMTVRIVKLGPHPQPELSMRMYSLDSAIDNVLGPEPILKTSVTRNLEKAQPGPPIRREKTFHDLLNVSCAVHAEIQLLFYFELQENDTFPRIIVSTKKPCFLCYLFCQLHGQCHVPRTHGRLYEKWTLPGTFTSWSTEHERSVNKVFRRFLQELRKCVVETVARAGKGGINPAESLCLEDSMWTRISRAASLQSLRDAMSKLLTPRPFSINNSHDRIMRLLHSSVIALAAHSSDPIKLYRGTPIAFGLSTSPRNQPNLVNSNQIHMYFSNQARRSDDNKHPLPSPSCTILVTICHIPEHEQIQEPEASTIDQASIDVGRLDPGKDIEVQLSTSNTIKILCNNEKLLIRFSWSLQSSC